MSPSFEQRETGDIARGFFLQAVLLFVAMLLPFAVLEGYEISLGVVAIMAAYAIGAVYVKGRGQPKAEPKDKNVPRDHTAFFAFMLYMGGGFLIASGGFGSIVFLCLGFAYTGPDGDLLVLDETVLSALGHTVTMLSGGIVALALALLLLHWNRGGLGMLGQRIRRHGIGLFLAPWLSEIALLTLLLGGSTIASLPIVLELLVDSMSVGRRALFPDGFWLFPFLPLCMFATAVTTVATVGLSLDYRPVESVIRAMREGEARPRPHDPWWPALVTIILCASAGVMASSLWVGHFALTAATAAAPAIHAGVAAVGAIDDWSAQQEAAGRPIAEIVAAINENGHWSTAEPDRGLPELLPDLAADLAEQEMKRDCRIAIAAAPIDPAATNGIEWPGIPEGWGNSKDNAGEPDEGAGAEPDEPWEPPAIRYCLKATCASPVSWDAPPAVFLYSSHPSDSPEWMLWMYIDLFAAGHAPEPGGYCTETGALAEHYQG